ncbi:MAG: DUF58 domain-containing protein [Candidatus Eremiobacteraeota bacterium]|nr:DUF58 domain-containing protein [Candidatus Eremiobacteraeota bacterium]
MIATPDRYELNATSRVGLILAGAAFVLAACAGATNPSPRAVIVFALAFPLLWVAFATFISLRTIRGLKILNVDLPERTRALGGFRLRLTLAYDGSFFPAVGILANARFSTDEVEIAGGPWDEIPLLDGGRAAHAEWEVLAKQRGRLYVGPFRAAIELPGSALRATAVFDGVHTVTVLPATFQLEPFADALLSGRHVAEGRYHKTPVATEEYVGAREYRPGDSPKLIHRVLSLRSRDPNELYVREFQDPSRDDLCIVLDTAAPLDGDSSAHQYRLEKAICFVAALCRTFAARRLTVRFVCQRGSRDVLSLRVRPLDAELDRLEVALSQIGLGGDRKVIGRLLHAEVRRHGSAVIFVSLRSREAVEQQRLRVVTLTPDHVPIFTHEVVAR